VCQELARRTVLTPTFLLVGLVYFVISLTSLPTRSGAPPTLDSPVLVSWR